MVVYTNNEKN